MGPHALALASFAARAAHGALYGDTEPLASSQPKRVYRTQMPYNASGTAAPCHPPYYHTDVALSTNQAAHYLA